MKKKTLAIVDDHFLFRKGIISLLKEFKELSVVIEAQNGQELLDKLKTKHPDVILLDIQMPVMDGIEAIIQVRKKYPDIKIIVLTMHSEEQMIFHLMEKGANGFLPKDTDIEIVVDAIYSVVEKGYYFNDKVSKAMVKGVTENKKATLPTHLSALSPREIDVVKLICKQKTIKEIAEELCLSPRTIDTYRENIFHKTGAKNIVGIAFYALKYNLLE